MNTKIRCLLLDDELPGLTYLRMMCEQFPEVEVVKAFNDPLRFLEESRTIAFDLCIIDIEMPGMNGLEVAQLLRNKPVIFTTAYKEYAAEAFDLEAIDYVRKPIQKDRLEKALQKAAIRIRGQQTEKTFVQLNTNKGKALLFFDQLLHITTAAHDKRDKLATLSSGETLLLKNISFDQLRTLLPSEGFCRISKKDLIALSTVRFFSHDQVVTSIPAADKSELVLTLSETYREEFHQKLGR